MGLETEYGISVPGDPMANPMFLSGQVVSVYAAAQGIRSNQSSWDYAFEDPLRDARGWQLDRQTADPSQLTDIEDPTLANVVLTNGARYYVDHAHPEYSSPEVTLPRDAVTWDRAGDAIALESVRLLAARPGQPPVNLYKNNADGKGQSYGTHENYLMPRRTPFPDIVPRPHPVLRDAPGRLRRRPGRARGRQPGSRLPDLPARRLLRDRGRARDHAQAPDHQHPRRAARRRRPLPAPARHHRRRQPPRRRDPAQDRHDLARARHDRGRTPHRGLVRPAPGRRPPDGLARPVARGHGRARRRPHGDRPRRPVDVPRGRPHLAGPARRRPRARGDRRGHGSLGGGPHRPRARRHVVRARCSTGSPSCSSSRATAPATACPGTTTGSPPSTSSGPTCAPRRGSCTGCGTAACSATS